MGKFGRLLTGVALLIAVCGCGAATTAPVATGDTSTGGLQDPARRFRGTPRLLARTVDLAGDLGASVENGRWSVDIPANAVEGAARITIKVATTSGGECTMEVVPADKNKFDVPAVVTADCASLTDARLAQSVLLEYDPATRSWVQVPGSTVDAAHRTVSALVDHVARYTVGPEGGKAGW